MVSILLKLSSATCKGRSNADLLMVLHVVLLVDDLHKRLKREVGVLEARYVESAVHRNLPFAFGSWPTPERPTCVAGVHSQPA